MSELKTVEIVKVGARASMLETPIQICMETLDEITNLRCYTNNVAIRVGDVLLVKDAP